MNASRQMGSLSVNATNPGEELFSRSSPLEQSMTCIIFSILMVGWQYGWLKLPYVLVFGSLFLRWSGPLVHAQRPLVEPI